MKEESNEDYINPEDIHYEDDGKYGRITCLIMMGIGVVGIYFLVKLIVWLIKLIF